MDDQNLATEALQDPAERVQIAAIRTLSASEEISPNAISGLIETFEKAETASTVRSHIAVALGNVREQHPQAQVAMEYQIANASPSLKETIENALQAQ